jgi:hypothetical protein
MSEESVRRTRRGAAAIFLTAALGTLSTVVRRRTPLGRPREAPCTLQASEGRSGLRRSNPINGSFQVGDGARLLATSV